ncbi:MAG: hypothetical protein F9K25_16490 [Candidatus Contendobacter sp.]|nr:MAG: hypothetical protein F9K25_16490 [Candidatus Contendobacter sp.]
MASLTDKLRTLNNADLSGLSARIDALRAKLKKDLAANAKGNVPGAGLSVEELLAALERARQRT